MRELVTGALVCIVGFAATPRAAAQCSGTHKWPNGSELRVWLNRQSFTDLGYDGTAVEHLTRAAIDEWAVSGRSNIRMKYSGQRNFATGGDVVCDNVEEDFPDFNEGEDVVIWISPGDDPCVRSIAAFTKCIGGNAGPCGIQIWNEPSGLSWTEGWPDSAQDVQSLWDVITHELGHSACLPHSNPGVTDPNVVMYSNGQQNTSHRFLKPMDVWALQQKYGDRTNYDVSHRYSGDGATWGSYGNFSFSPEPQDGVALDVGWDMPSNAFYVAAWSEPGQGDEVRISYGDGVSWDQAQTVGLDQIAKSVQVPAVAIGEDSEGTTWTVVAYLSGTSHISGACCTGGSFAGGTGRTIEVKATDDFGTSTWVGPAIIGESYSGPALAHYGDSCFIIAYATADSGYRDQIRTKVSCDGGVTWSSTLTNAERTTDRPAIAWGDNLVWGGIVWTTNVTGAGNPTANYMRTGRLENVWGYIDVVPSPDTLRLYTSNFPALTVADNASPQPGRFVRTYRRYVEVAGGREIRAQYSDDMSTNDWSVAVVLQSARGPSSAAYDDWYNEFWSLYVR